MTNVKLPEILRVLAEAERSLRESLTPREALISYISDDFKDIHGFRPRHWDFDSMTDEQLQTIFDNIRVEYEERLANADKGPEYDRMPDDKRDEEEHFAAKQRDEQEKKENDAALEHERLPKQVGMGKSAAQLREGGNVNLLDILLESDFTVPKPRHVPEMPGQESSGDLHLDMVNALDADKKARESVLFDIDSDETSNEDRMVYQQALSIIDRNIREKERILSSLQKLNKRKPS